MTLPDLMHAVQAFTRRGAPFTMARTRWMLGFQRRLVRTCECDTDMPHDGPLPQTSHTAAIRISNLPVRTNRPQPRAVSTMTLCLSYSTWGQLTCVGP